MQSRWHAPGSRQDSRSPRGYWLASVQSSLPGGKTELSPSILFFGLGEERMEDTEGISCLSNFFPTTLRLQGEIFHSSEYQYQKCCVYGDLEMRKAVLRSRSAREAKQLGQKARPANSAAYEEWLETKGEAMFQATLAKFSQSSQPRQFILSTGEKRLLECTRASPFWSTGVALFSEAALDEKDWAGQSELGRVLARVRETLRGELVSSFRLSLSLYTREYNGLHSSQLFSGMLAVSVIGFQRRRRGSIDRRGGGRGTGRRGVTVVAAATASLPA
jgi:ribA/ribD-fused uncharacterized protein